MTVHPTSSFCTVSPHPQLVLHPDCLPSVPPPRMLVPTPGPWHVPFLQSLLFHSPTSFLLLFQSSVPMSLPHRSPPTSQTGADPSSPASQPLTLLFNVYPSCGEIVVQPVDSICAPHWTIPSPRQQGASSLSCATLTPRVQCRGWGRGAI